MTDGLFFPNGTTCCKSPLEVNAPRQLELASTSGEAKSDSKRHPCGPPSILRRSASIDAIASVAPSKHRRPPASSTHLPPQLQLPICFISKLPEISRSTCDGQNLPCYYHPNVQHAFTSENAPSLPNKRHALFTATTIRRAMKQQYEAGHKA